MNARNSFHDPLFETIVAAIENCGQLTAATVDFIETALFPVSYERLAAFLTDEEAECERESLLDLVFSPDLTDQAALEPQLEAACLRPADAARLQDRLLTILIRSWIKMPDGTRLTPVVVSDYFKIQYLQRLNISWRMDGDLRSTIDQNLAAETGLAVKVRFRNANLLPTPNQRKQLCRFFERVTDDDPDYLACLDLFLGLMQKETPAGQAFDRFAEHKRFLYRSLTQARRFETLLQQSNMETLMLQGVRPPYASPDQLTREMRQIDLITMQMFGKTEVILPAMDDPLRIISDLDDPVAAVRSVMGDG